MKYFNFIFVLFLLLPYDSKSLNIFEYSLIGTGIGLVYSQYFDNSLDYESEMSKKMELINEFYNSKRTTIANNKFYSLPIQEQLLVIEDLYSLNN
tara:strand:+ start:243 stop:527 length:285 start_codon:yes stop_codon:yes gene_type:complete